MYALSRPRDFLNKLPPFLFLQLDNYGGDKKNHYLFSFASMLTSKNIFTMVYVSFLLVGHTHEDIDGTYGRLSILHKIQDILSLSRIMGNYRMVQDEINFTPYLIVLDCWFRPG